MLITDPAELSVYIAKELRQVVPVRTGRLRDSIESSPTGVMAVDYYKHAMSTAENASLEKEAIDTGTILYLEELEDSIENIFK